MSVPNMTYVCNHKRCWYEEHQNWLIPCAEFAVQEINKIDARYRGGVTYDVVEAEHESEFPQPPSEGICTVRLNNYPIYKEGEGVQCGAGWACEDKQKPVYASCRHSSHGPAAVSECGSLSKRYSAPGRSLAQIDEEAQLAWTSLQAGVQTQESLFYAKQPTCTTCEHVPLNASEASSQYACLDANLQRVPELPAGSAPAGVDRTALEKQIIGRLKLLFELKGHVLSEAQRERIRALYPSHPESKKDCGLVFAPPAGVDNSCGPMGEINSRMDMCMRLTGAYVPAASAYASIHDCVALASQVAPLDEELCKGKEYREAWSSLWLSLFEKSSSNLQRDLDGIPARADLQARLGTIQHWFNTVRGSFYPQNAPDELWRGTSKTLGVFWKSAYAGGLLSKDSQELIAEDPLNLGLLTDQAILGAALNPVSGSSQLPLQGPPLLFLLGDGFRGLHDRIEDVSYLHDMGCRFQSCQAGKRRSEVSELWELLGSSADASTLQTAVNNATLLASAPSHRQGWRTLFDGLRAQHGTFEAAVAESFGVPAYSPGLLLNTAPASLPEPVVSMAKYIQNGRAHTASYTASGSFLGTARDSLRIGIQETKQAQLNGQILARKQGLEAAKSTYLANRSSYVSARLAEMNNAQQRASLLSQLDKQLEQFNQLAADLVGLRANAATEEAAYSDFASAFNAALEAEQADLARLRIVREPPHTLSISAAEGRYLPSMRYSPLTDYAVQQAGSVWKVAAQAGDILNVQTSGQWAPACALSQAKLRKPMSAPEVLPEPVNLGTALTGPEGYLVMFRDDAFQAESNSASQYSGSSSAGRACAGVRVEVGMGWDTILTPQISAYAYTEACLNAEAGKNSSHESSSGGEQRVSAAYSTGIRLQETPFPSLPAGSLLLVQVEKGSTSLAGIRDIQVVQAPWKSAVIGSKPGLQPGQVDPGVDVYLVANDAGSSGCAKDTAHALSLTVQKLEPAGTAARQMGQAMSKVLTDMRASTEAFVAQGRVLQQDVIAKREAAMSRLKVECAQCDLEGFPPSLLSLYTTFVSKELARMERQVEIRAVERAMALLSMELKATADDLDAATTQGRVLRLVPAWSLRNLEAEQLRDASRALTTLVTDYLYPVMDLRYAHALAGLKTEPVLTRLILADWTQPYVDLTSKALLAVEKVETALASARLNDPSPQFARVALSFPRPGRQPPSSWRKVTEARAKAVWDALLSTSAPKLRASIHLTPEDLYAAIGGESGTLQCTEGVPILSRLAFFFTRAGGAASQNADLNGMYLRSATSYGAALSYPGVEGIKTYFMEEPVWRVGQSRLLFGVSSAALSTFQNQELSLPEQVQTTTGDGLSPFTTVEFDVTGLRSLPVNPLDAADELVVVMQVDRRTVATLGQPSVCQNFVVE
ncbi:hypothetical protein [Stigmatella aurantiaca]|nr:hypothetical protein [Stigmatella aurantiaca]